MSNAFSRARILIFALPLLTLTACSSTTVSTPRPLALTLPTATTIPAGLAPPPVQLTVLDRRIHNHILRIEHRLDQAEFATSESPLATLISEALREALTIQEQAETHLTLVIEEALIRAVRFGNTYEVNHTLILSIQGVRDTRQVDVTMTTRMGPQTFRRLEHTRIEQDFNRNLNATLRALLNEPELTEFFASNEAKLSFQ